MKQEGEVLNYTDALAPGVHGYSIEANGAIYYPVVVAIKPGNGDVARFLDSLPQNKTLRFPCVVSPKLEGMLQRRRFVATKEWSKEFHEWVDIYERLPEGMRA